MKFWSTSIHRDKAMSDGLLLLSVLGFGVYCLTPVGMTVFESSMVRHMLIQLPLLGVAGALLLPRCGAAIPAWLLKIDPAGAIGLIVASGWMLYWMLPVSLDMATIDPAHRLLKVVFVPLGIGFCVRWAWRQAGPVLRIIIAFEVWASIARLGWLYVESPEQLCSSYLLGEQQIVGEFLLALSAVSCVAGLVWGFFGSFKEVEIVPSPVHEQDIVLTVSKKSVMTGN